MPSTNIYCTACGSANHLQAAFCFNCGQKLFRGTGSTSMAPTTHVSGASPEGAGQLAPGQILNGRYQIISLVGQGGMGVVYKAKDTALGDRQVAIKEMSTASLYPNEVTGAAELFKQEALTLAKLHHPNLPSIHDHFSEANHWYLVMSFIEGESLARVLEKTSGERLSVSEAIKIGCELCDVLDYLHSQQPPIIFRDLKPSNIMYTVRGDIYLIDFGIARHFKSDKTKDTVNYGTPGYASPERFGQQTTPRSDVYSLGATLHRMLSGHNPAHTPFLFPSLHSLGIAVPDDLEALIQSMLAIDPNYRPASMREVKQRLQRIATNLSPAQTTQPPSREKVPEAIPGPTVYPPISSAQLQSQSTPPIPYQYTPQPPYSPYLPQSSPYGSAMPASRDSLPEKGVLLVWKTIIGFILLSAGITCIMMFFYGFSFYYNINSRYGCHVNGCITYYSYAPLLIVIGGVTLPIGIFFIRQCIPTIIGKCQKLSFRKVVLLTILGILLLLVGTVYIGAPFYGLHCCGDYEFFLTIEYLIRYGFLPTYAIAIGGVTLPIGIFLIWQCAPAKFGKWSCGIGGFIGALLLTAGLTSGWQSDVWAPDMWLGMCFVFWGELIFLLTHFRKKQTR